MKVRHGQTTWNERTLCQGRIDTPLSPLGLRQAEAISSSLAGEPIAHVITSELKHAKVTGEYIGHRHGLPVHISMGG